MIGMAEVARLANAPNVHLYISVTNIVFMVLNPMFMAVLSANVEVPIYLYSL